jgi:hypothetical protein
MSDYSDCSTHSSSSDSEISTSYDRQHAEWDFEPLMPTESPENEEILHSARQDLVEQIPARSRLLNTDWLVYIFH